jgi:hypothetical protein
MSGTITNSRTLTSERSTRYSAVVFSRFTHQGQIRNLDMPAAARGASCSTLAFLAQVIECCDFIDWNRHDGRRNGRPPCFCACRLGALPACLVTAARTFALGGDAWRRFLLPREVRDRRTSMVIGIGNVDAMVRVNRDLEEVGKAPVGAAQ